MHEVKKVIDEFIGKCLVFLETFIAIVSVIVLVALLGVELGSMLTEPNYFLAPDAVSNFLQEILSIVVALEFIKLLLHLTPANILEVLTLAIARGIIVNHGTAIDNLLSIACIIGMFAARRYLIPRNELYRDMDEEAPTPQHTRRHSKQNKHHKQEAKKEENQEASAH